VLFLKFENLKKIGAKIQISELATLGDFKISKLARNFKNLKFGAKIQISKLATPDQFFKFKKWRKIRILKKLATLGEF
jgi:hypothetical protein